METESLNSYIDLYNQIREMPKQLTKKKEVLHYPQLDTVLMVEKFIQSYGGEFKKKSLWQHLPKKMMYQTFCVVFDYLLESGKIAVDKEGHICWIWDPEGVKKLLKRKNLAWR